MMSREINSAAAVLALALGVSMPAAAADAMRVVRDPQTGELRGPNAAEAAAFEKAEAQLRARSGKPAIRTPAEVRYPDGTVETKLGDDTLMYSVVSSAADGSLVYDCLPATQAQQFVRTGGKMSKRAPGTKGVVKVGHGHQ